MKNCALLKRMRNELCKRYSCYPNALAGINNFIAEGKFLPFLKLALATELTHMSYFEKIYKCCTFYFVCIRVSHTLGLVLLFLLQVVSQYRIQVLHTPFTTDDLSVCHRLKKSPLLMKF